MSFFKTKNFITTAYDPLVVNPWGLVIQTSSTLSGETELWIANNGAGNITHYNLKNPAKLVSYKSIKVASLLLGGHGTPTGLVRNNTTGFSITKNNITASALLITVTQDGQILGWNPTVDPVNFVNAYTSLNNAFYTGVEIVGNLLYVTDFYNGSVDVFNSSFVLQSSVTYPFHNPIPLPFNHPFNIKYLNGNLVVNYAVNNGENVRVLGPGFGLINVFNTDGVFVRRLVNALDNLNAPWGLSYFPQPKVYGSNNILVGNSGDGTVQVRNDISGNLVEYLRTCGGEQIQIEGLWGLQEYKNAIVYTSGPNNGTSGAVGVIYRDDCDDECGCEEKKKCGCEEKKKCGCEEKKKCGCEEKKKCGCEEKKKCGCEEKIYEKKEKKKPYDCGCG